MNAFCQYFHSSFALYSKIWYYLKFLTDVLALSIECQYKSSGVLYLSLPGYSRIQMLDTSLCYSTNPIELILSAIQNQAY